MKKFLIAIVLFFPATAFAGTQNVHHENNPPYNCEVTPAPGSIGWVKKDDKSGNKQIRLKWRDSYKAHDVEIEYSGKVITVPDDGKQLIKKLKKNKSYQFRMRGVSNCGQGEWTKVYKFKA